jgi:hypothetical protein
MSVNKYTKIYFGLYIPPDIVAAQRHKVQTTHIVQPTTKFNPNTGERNKSTQQVRTEWQWKAPFDKLFGDNEYELPEDGVPLLGFTAAQPYGCDGIYIFEDSDYISKVQGSEKLRLAFDTDTEATKNKFKRIFEPLGVWDVNNFGIWAHSYWS